MHRADCSSVGFGWSIGRSAMHLGGMDVETCAAEGAASTVRLAAVRCARLQGVQQRAGEFV